MLSRTCKVIDELSPKQYLERGIEKTGKKSFQTLFLIFPLPYGP